MARVRDRKTGQIIEISDDQLGQAILMGNIDVDPQTRVPVVNQYGQVGTVEAQEFMSGEAGLRGMRLATPQEIIETQKQEQYGEGLGSLRAALEGAGRGLSLGLSDAALVALGSDVEGLRERKERNPMLAGGGEALGILGSVLATGGLGGVAQGAERGTLALAGRAGMGALRASPAALVARAGQATEAGLAGFLGSGTLGRIGSAATAAGIEGSLYGAGEAISEAALGDYELTAEQVLASMKTGAVWGGGVGGAVSAIGPLARAAMEQGKGIAKASEQLLPAAFAKAIKTQSLEKYISETAFAAAKGAAGGKRFVERAKRALGDNAIEIIGRDLLDEGVVTTQSTLNDIVKIATQKKQEWGQKIGDLMRSLDENAAIELRPLRKDIAEKLEKEVIGPLSRSKLPDFQRMAKQVRSKLDPFLAEGEFARVGKDARISFEELHRLRAELDDLAFPKNKLSVSPVIEKLQKARSVIEQELSETAEKASKRLGNDFAQTYKGAKQKYASMSLAKDMGEDAISRLETNRNFSLSDMLVSQGVGVAAGISEIMATGDLDLGTLATAFIAGRVHRFFRTRGSAILAGTLDKATKYQKLSTMQNAARQTETATKSAVSRYFEMAKDTAKRTKRLVAPIAEKSTETEPLSVRYQNASDRHDDILRDPGSIARNATQSFTNISDAAPQTVTLMTSAAVRAAEFLKSKRPASNDHVSDTFAHLGKRQKYSDSMMSKYLRYAEMVEDPLGTIKDFGDTGYMSREGAEALRIVYPRLYQQFESTVMERLAEQTEPLPYDQLQQLSFIFNRPMHPTLEPSFIAMCQDMYAETEKDQRDSGLSPSRRKVPNTAKRHYSDAQKLA